MEAQKRILEKWSSRQASFSVEFFPPKEEKDARQLLRAAHAIHALPVDFASITYGAGGSSRERTLDYGELIADIFNFNIMPHLTLVGHSREELLTILARYKKAGFFSIMALRGDPPRGAENFTPAPGGLSHASELVSLIRATYGNDFLIGVAGYPEKHPEAGSSELDLRYLKEKVDCGANFVTTQMFFDNKKFFDFEKRSRAIGIDVPIIAGIMPIISLKQLERVNSMCKVHVPAPLYSALADADARGDKAAGIKIGFDWAEKQIHELIAAGVSGIHLYIMNRACFAQELCAKLGNF